jgi:phage terminase large subunit GpA-like protein
MLAQRASVEPGRYRVSRTTYVRAIMDALSPGQPCPAGRVHQGRPGGRDRRRPATKAETYRYLRLERPTEVELAAGEAHPPGAIHLPQWIDDEWLKQLVVEQLLTVRTKRGFARLEWQKLQKLRERNEALHYRFYARAAAWIASADRWTDERWWAMEEQMAQSQLLDDDRVRSKKANARVKQLA